MGRRPICRAVKKTGQPCKNPAIDGGDVCRFHGGNAPQVKAKAAVRAEALAWGFGDKHGDPGEILLRLVTQSAARCQRYAGLLEEAYDAAERLKAAHDAQKVFTVEPDKPLAAEQQARADLDRVFNQGGISALIGNTYSAANDGSIYATGEAIRGLADLEAKERDRCAAFAAKAVAAGLAKRQVELAERQGALIVQLLTATLADPELGLSAEQRRRVPDVARRHLALVSS